MTAALNRVKPFKVGTWNGAAVYWHPVDGLSWEWDHSWLLQFSNPAKQHAEIEWLPLIKEHKLEVYLCEML